MKLEDKVAIITGGAGGIGKIISKYYLKEGAKVVIVDIDNFGLDIIIKELNNVHSIGIEANISDIQQVKKLVKRTIDTFGDIDILVNVAGIQRPIGRLIDVDDSEWIKNVNTNLIGTMLCCKHVLPIMVSKRKGKIINFSGGGATFPRPNFSAYASTKAAIVRFTETVAEEVKDFGVDINAIAPGSIYTKMIEEIISSEHRSGQKDLEAAIKLKETGGNDPGLVAELAVFLASPASDGITGKLISASWDDWKSFDKNEMNNSSLFTMRRVDGIKIVDKNYQ